MLIEDLQRLHFKLQVESQLQNDADAARRLTHLAIETEDTLAKARELLSQSSVDQFAVS